GQLRLKGFYADDMLAPSEMKISRVQDYLNEYCGFGCPYFILRNMQINERAKNKWLREQKKLTPRKKNSKGRQPKKTKKSRKPVSKRNNEVVGTGKKKRQKTFTIREKK
ncbi:YutD family protein, partial [Enterococcus faecium]|nr:YutD family protein [Enterococcus faecium]